MKNPWQKCEQGLLGFRIPYIMKIEPVVGGLSAVMPQVISIVLQYILDIGHSLPAFGA